MDPLIERELRLMVDDNAQARSPFAVAGPVWPNLCDVIRSKLEKGESFDNINRHFASYPPDDRHYPAYAAYLGRSTQTGTWYATACDAYFEKINEKHPEIASIAPLPLTWDTVLSLDEVASMVDADPRLLNQQLTVMDLGSGWGRIGHILMLLNPLINYVACDIPMGLIVAQDVLPKYVTVPVHCYSECRDIEVFDKSVLKSGVWFCGTQQLDHFADKSVDVFVNIASFQELTLTQVTEYFTIIDRVTDGILYTRQRHQGDELTRDNYPYPGHWQRLYDRGIAFSPGYFEACFRV